MIMPQQKHAWFLAVCGFFHDRRIGNRLMRSKLQRGRQSRHDAFRSDTLLNSGTLFSVLQWRPLRRSKKGRIETLPLDCPVIPA